MSRPTALPVIVAGIPEALRRERRWVVWGYDFEPSRQAWVKRPRARTNDPSTWCGFDDAVSRYRAGRLDGIGFALGDGFSGGDIDDCRDPKTGDLPLGAQDIIDSTPCYREVSPSGTGIKFIGRSDRIGFELAFDTGKVTPWTNARFFAITGHSLGGDPDADLSPLIDEWIPAAPQPIPSGERAGFKNAELYTDDDLVVYAVGHDDHGVRFLRLWRGDCSDYASQSEADLALCRMLAFWTNSDRERVDRIFRCSNLYRPKWDSASYRRSTLDKAMR